MTQHHHYFFLHASFYKKGLLFDKLQVFSTILILCLSAGRRLSMAIHEVDLWLGRAPVKIVHKTCVLRGLKKWLCTEEFRLSA